MQILTKTNFNFLRWRWHAIALSLLVIAGGVFMLATQGLPLGIDFSGGAAFIVQGASEGDIRRALDAIPGDKVIQQYDDPSKGQILVRLPQPEDGTTLEAQAQQIEQTLASAGLKTTIVGRELVSAVIGEDLQRRGLYATLASILAIAVYIAIRFRPSFAIGAIAATLHDVFVTLAFLAFFGYDL
jgi:preprotein translocase subunit SecF